MGSLRNPIGPLPSTIYWRRRGIALSALVLLVLLVVWVLSLGGDGGDKRADAGSKDGTNGQGPTDAITPGPSDSSPRVSERPGGRDEADGGTGSGGDSAGEDGGSGGGDSGGDGGGESSGSAGGGDSTDDSNSGALGGSGGSVTGGGGTPAHPALPRCDSGVTVSLNSVEDKYAPGEKPKFKLTLTNSGDSDCRVNLGRAAAALTITDGAGARVWSSADCPPSSAAAYVEVPAGGDTTQDMVWNRKRSKPACEKAPADAPGADTYRATVTVPGLGSVDASFTLTKD